MGEQFFFIKKGKDIAKTLTKEVHQPVRCRKNVHVCYFMGSFAYGFGTRALPSNSLATTANFAS